MEDVGRHMAEQLPAAELCWTLDRERVISVSGQLDLLPPSPGKEVKQFLQSLVPLCLKKSEEGEGLVRRLMEVAFGEDGGMR